MSETYETIECRDALHFLETLAPRNTLWFASRHPVSWVYRGQSDASWPLLPRAHRLEGWHSLKASFHLNHGTLPLDLARLEFLLWQSFLDKADLVGCPLPDHSYELRQRWLHSEDEFHEKVFPYEWPYDCHIPILALMQHHGLPTRLLDWSRRGYIAAYFAASDAAEKLASATPEKQDARDLDGHLAVWALRTDLIHVHRNKDTGKSLINLVQVPSFLNDNLRAQHGIFTLVRSGRLPSPHLAPPPYEALVSTSWPEPHLRKITLGYEHVFQVLGLLAIEGVSAASLFPGPSGVVKALKDEGFARNLWDMQRTAELAGTEVGEG